MSWKHSKWLAQWKRGPYQLGFHLKVNPISDQVDKLKVETLNCSSWNRFESLNGSKKRKRRRVFFCCCRPLEKRPAVDSQEFHSKISCIHKSSKNASVKEEGRVKKKNKNTRKKEKTAARGHATKNAISWAHRSQSHFFIPISCIISYLLDKMWPNNHRQLITIS